MLTPERATSRLRRARPAWCPRKVGYPWCIASQAATLDAQVELLHRRARFELARGAFERDPPRLEDVGAASAGKRHRGVLLGEENGHALVGEAAHRAGNLVDDDWREA